MHNLETVELTFDPSKSDNEKIREIFKNHASTVIWCSIKSCNVVDQYFNDIVLEVVKKLDDKSLWKYREFLKVVEKLTNSYGTVCVSLEAFCGCEHEIDHEFWSDIHKAINRKRCFNLKIM